MNYRMFVLVLLLGIYCSIELLAENPSKKIVKIGVISVLSGDLAELGNNIVLTVETYKKHNLRHPIKFVYEDAKLSSADGLRAYQKLINFDKVDMIISGSSSNGTMAASSLINGSKTPTISVVTGGSNIDHAGSFIFRIGNSDIINGIQEADNFIDSDVRRIALFTEETEYTQDIARSFVERFQKRRGQIVFNKEFLPGTGDFRTEIAMILRTNPEGIFMPTQTGLALGIFLKQWKEQGGTLKIPIHTTFVAAPNANAHKIAGDALIGVGYMAPQYDKDSEELKKFFTRYHEDHGKDPAIPFHTAGTVDALNLLQRYLDSYATFDKIKFVDFLLTTVKDYKGLMGRYSFDSSGNANLGFSFSRIESIIKAP